METLVNRTTGEAVPLPPLCRGLVLAPAPAAEAARPHLDRIEEVSRHSHPHREAGAPTRRHAWHAVPLATLVPLLQEDPGRTRPEGLPPQLAFPADEAGGAPQPPDLILCLDDDTLGLTGRLALLRCVREVLPDVPLLLLVGEIAPEHAVEALRAGATDLLARRDWPALPILVERVLRRASARASSPGTPDAERTRRQKEIEKEREGELRRLRASEEKYRLLFEHVPEPVAVLQSATGTLLLANRALRDLLGHEEEPHASPPTAPPLAGRHLSVLFPPEAEAEADKLLHRLREERGAIAGRYFLRQPGGAPPRPVDLRAAPVPWGPLTPTPSPAHGTAGATGTEARGWAVVVAFQDAALREESGAGAALAYFALDRLGEAALGGAIPGAGEWVLWADGAGTLLHANRPFCEALGRPLVRLRGRHIGEIAPALGPGAWALHRGEARAYGAFRIETAFHAEDGTPHRAEAMAHALTLGGREYHCFIGRGVPKPAEPAAPAS